MTGRHTWTSLKRNGWHLRIRRLSFLKIGASWLESSIQRSPYHAFLNNMENCWEISQTAPVRHSSCGDERIEIAENQRRLLFLRCRLDRFNLCILSGNAPCILSFSHARQIICIVWLFAAEKRSKPCRAGRTKIYVSCVYCLCEWAMSGLCGFACWLYIFMKKTDKMETVL